MCEKEVIMRIKLEAPYCHDYKQGYLINGSESRKMVVLIANDGSKHCTSYARYLMTVHRGTYLRDNETVDHIDEDKSNDCIENLQILSREENVKKHAEFTKQPFEHGTYRMYHIGKCRCELCKQANREVMNRYHAKHRDEINQRRRQKRAENKKND